MIVENHLARRYLAQYLMSRDLLIDHVSYLPAAIELILFKCHLYPPIYGREIQNLLTVSFLTFRDLCETYYSVLALALVASEGLHSLPCAELTTPAMKLGLGKQVHNEDVGSDEGLVSHVLRYDSVDVGLSTAMRAPLRRILVHVAELAGVASDNTALIADPGVRGELLAHHAQEEVKGVIVFFDVHVLQMSENAFVAFHFNNCLPSF